MLSSDLVKLNGDSIDQSGPINSKFQPLSTNGNEPSLLINGTTTNSGNILDGVETTASFSNPNVQTAKTNPLPLNKNISNNFYRNNKKYNNYNSYNGPPFIPIPPPFMSPFHMPNSQFQFPIPFGMPQMDMNSFYNTSDFNSKQSYMHHRSYVQAKKAEVRVFVLFSSFGLSKNVKILTGNLFDKILKY
jgi:hypothetical protein